MNITSTGTNKNIYTASRNTGNTAYNRKTETNQSSASFQSEISSFPKNSNTAVSNSAKEEFYSDRGTKAAVSEEYIMEQKKKFADMYVTSAAHKYFYDNKFKTVSESGLSSILIKSVGIAIKEDCMLIPIEAGELPHFMDTVQSSLKSGRSLADILKQKYDDHISKYGEEGHLNSFADWFAINTSTGEVMSAIPISRTYHGDSYDDQLSDIEAVMELADDLASFLKYAVFSQDQKDQEDPEKVKELLSFIKNKQAYANYDRFLADGEEGAVDAVLQRLIDAGVLKDDEEEQEEAVDGLMEAIRVHQEELRENRIDVEESEKAIAEIREMIDNRSNP